MTIYQIINKQNQLEYAYLNYEVAVEELAKLNQASEDNYYTIVAIEDKSSWAKKLISSTKKQNTGCFIDWRFSY